jgi:KDO2-lipid IV(A) lauroyltransferase
MMKRFTAWLGGVGWLLSWRIARLLPERLVVAGFERMSARRYRRDARTRAVIAQNLEPIIGSSEQAVRDSFRWYGRYWAETFRMQDLTHAQIDARMRTTGLEHIERAYAAGRGAVLATPHLGNWDAGGRFVAQRWPVTAVVEVLRPRMVFDRFVAHRRSLGIGVVPLERGADPTTACLERVRAGELVALVADRDLSASAVKVTMFGRTARMPPGAAVIALRSGAPLIPAAVYQHDDGTWLGTVLAPLEKPSPEQPDAVAVLTQRLADAFEELIRAQPAQWHVFGPYWGRA